MNTQKSRKLTNVRCAEVDYFERREIRVNDVIEHFCLKKEDSADLQEAQ